MENANTNPFKKKFNWSKYAFEFLTMFIAIISAFALENWNDNRKTRNVETKILQEIKNGLQKDIEDIRLNVRGHNEGIRACSFFRNLICNDSVNLDSVGQKYYNLTRDFVSIQNNSGYESLKSNGLQIVKDDSLRFKIISLYEYDFNTLSKLEEDYSEMQFSQSYFIELNNILSERFLFNSSGSIIGIDHPLMLDNKQENKLMSYLWKIQNNRIFIQGFYSSLEEKINRIIEEIDKV